MIKIARGLVYVIAFFGIAMMASGVWSIWRGDVTIDLSHFPAAIYSNKNGSTGKSGGHALGMPRFATGGDLRMGRVAPGGTFADPAGAYADDANKVEFNLLGMQVTVDTMKVLLLLSGIGFGLVIGWILFDRQRPTDNFDQNRW